MNYVYLVRDNELGVKGVFTNEDDAVAFQQNEGPSWVTSAGETVYDWEVESFPVQ